jgi:hypothetical protein
MKSQSVRKLRALGFGSFGQHLHAAEDVELAFQLWRIAMEQAQFLRHTRQIIRLDNIFRHDALAGHKAGHDIPFRFNEVHHLGRDAQLARHFIGGMFHIAFDAQLVGAFTRKADNVRAPIRFDLEIQVGDAAAQRDLLDVLRICEKRYFAMALSMASVFIGYVPSFGERIFLRMKNPLLS